VGDPAGYSSHMPITLHHGLAIHRLGEGEPILFMPGPHRFERPGLRGADVLIEGMVARGRAVITYDPPGSGRSTRPADLSMAEMHECTLEALDSLGITDPVDAVGHSMGGLCLLAWTLEHPERVDRLVLIGTGSGGPAYDGAPGALWHRAHPGFPKLVALGLAHLLLPTQATQTAMNNFVERHSFQDPRLMEPDPIAWRDWVRRREGHPEWHWIARKLDYAPRLGEITAPTLVACGLQDPQFPPGASEQLARHIPGATVAWFDRCGHYPYIETPGPFWEAWDGFMSQRSTD